MEEDVPEELQVRKEVSAPNPTKHFLLQPPGENNGNVLPGAVSLDAKKFEPDSDKDGDGPRDVNVLPGAIGLSGKFDESNETFDSFLPKGTTAVHTSNERRPAKINSLNKKSSTPSKHHSTLKNRKRVTNTTSSSTSAAKTGVRKSRKKKRGSSSKSSTTSFTETSSNSTSSSKDSKSALASKSSEDKESTLPTSATSKENVKKKKEKSRISKSPAATSTGPLYSGPHPMNREMTELQVPGDVGALDDAVVRTYYTKLVNAYLKPFVNGIPRKSFFEILRRRTYSLAPPGSNKGVQTLLFQLVDKKVYLLDPYEVAKNSKPFYKTRIQELIWLLSDIAKGDVVPDTEFLVAIHDCVQTVNQDHTYRGSVFKESSPTFTIVSCNFSDNIPFPMWEGDPVRGGLKSWDSKMEKYRSMDSTSWTEKEPKAVFRGGFRPSMYFKTKKEANEHCDDVGRTRLAFLSNKHSDLFDVGVSGKCGSNAHSMQHLSESQHHAFKYILYAEGNCFWADRLNKQVFGPSAVIKQETPCGQFWEPLLKPLTHYIPTTFFFSDTVEQITWARENDDKVKNIVEKANEFATAFLSVKGIKVYAEVLLVEYTKLLNKSKIKAEKGSNDVTI